MTHSTTTTVIKHYLITCSCGWQNLDPFRQRALKEADEYSAEKHARHHLEQHQTKAAARQRRNARRKAGTIKRQPCNPFEHVNVVISPFNRRQYMWRVTCACGYSTKSYPVGESSPSADYRRHFAYHEPDTFGFLESLRKESQTWTTDS